MTERVAVYTAIYGGGDRLLEPAVQDVEVDWYCFTDSRKLTSPTWNVVVEEPRHSDARLAAKWPKMLPDEFLPDHRRTVWVDANLLIDSPTFVRDVLALLRNGLSVFRHPLRDCIYHEAFACLSRADCREMPVVKQVRAYQEAGFPRRSGLYACGVLVRDIAVAGVTTLGHHWLEECLRWSPRDQLSFPLLLERFGVEPGVFPFHIGRAPVYLTAARYLGLTPGSFPRYLIQSSEARRLCSPRWFPPLRTLPLRWERVVGLIPKPVWQANPWFDVLPRSRAA